jgi:hypothetical protein
VNYALSSIQTSGILTKPAKIYEENLPFLQINAVVLLAPTSSIACHLLSYNCHYSGD